jgi:alcohol dehydrogenase
MSEIVDNIRYLSQGEMIAGNGLFKTLPKILLDRGYKRPGILVDGGFASSPLWLDIKQNLITQYGDEVFFHVLSEKSEPTYRSLRLALKYMQQTTHDVLVGIGGGSCMDTTKAIAGLLKNSGDPLVYRGFDQLKEPSIPTVLVPTTAGTGSEASHNASFVDEDSNQKMGINGRYMFANLAILDGETTLSCPYKAALSAGIDALVHTIEGFVCKQRNFMTDMLVGRAFPMLVNALPSLKNDKMNSDKRLELLIGAYLGGLIQMNAGSGIASAMSYPLSVFHKVPHGIGGGIFCLAVMRFNIDAGFYRYAELAPMIGVGGSHLPEKDNALAVLEHLEQLWDFLEVPTNLVDFGIKEDDFDPLVKSMESLQAGFDRNPVKFSAKTHLPTLLRDYFFETASV